MPTRGSPEEIQQKAQFRLEQAELRKRDADKSLAEQKAKSNAVAAKTIRLRALRLAKEAQDAADALAATAQSDRECATTEALPSVRAKKKAKTASQI